MHTSVADVMAQRSSQVSGGFTKCWPSDGEDVEAFVHVLTTEGPFGLHWPSADCPNGASPAEKAADHLLGDEFDIEKNKTRRWARKSKRLCKAKRERLNELAQRMVAMEEVELPEALRKNKFVMNKLMKRVEIMKKKEGTHTKVDFQDTPRVSSAGILNSPKDTSSQTRNEASSASEETLPPSEETLSPSEETLSPSEETSSPSEDDAEGLLVT